MTTVEAAPAVVVCPLCGYDLIREPDGTWRHQRAVVCPPPPPPSFEEGKPETPVPGPVTLTTGELLDRIGWTGSHNSGTTWLNRRAALVGQPDTPGSGRYRQWTLEQAHQLARLLDLEELTPERTELLRRLSTGRAWRRYNGRTQITITVEDITGQPDPIGTMVDQAVTDYLDEAATIR